jgi:photosynthetic reaction center cytochrome c subunit
MINAERRGVGQKRKFGIFIAAVVFATALGSAVRFQAEAQTAAGGEARAEQVFKNIQVLKGMPASQIRPMMSLITASLGMRCDSCHVPGEFDKDDKEQKQTARKMIRLVLDANKSAFDGETEVSCYTCHRGQARPVGVPVIGVPVSPVAAGTPTRPADALPGFDQIVEKYLAAVGNSVSYEKVKTRVMKGTVTDARGNYPVEVIQEAPDRIATFVTMPNGTTGTGYDGTTGWNKSARGVSELAGVELALMRRSADIARPLKIRDEALSPRVTGKATLGDRESYVVSARADGQRVQLFFDVETGLLLRRRVLIDTPIGALPQQTDYEDYREADGIRLPFVVKSAGPEPASATTTTYQEVSHNAAVDESRFAPPQK